MGRNTLIGVAIAALFGVAALVQGDVLVLRGGERIVGNITPATDADGNRGFRVTADDGTERWYALDAVEQFILGDADDDGGTSSRLASLRRSVKNAPDLDAIVRKYEAFLRLTEDGSPDALAAEEELLTWRQRRDDGYVQLGTAWVSPAERDRRLASAFGQLNEARLLVKSGDAQQARQLAEELSRDPASAAGGEYLLGVLALARDDVSAARQHFRAAQEIEPNHAPTLTNLAALQANYGQPQRAMWFLVEAMRAAPGNEQVIANALEALRLLSEEERDEKNARRAAALFEEQAAALTRTKNEAGLVRWGNTWIDAEQQRELAEQRAVVEERVATLKEQYDALATDLSLLEADIRRNVDSLRQMEQASIRRDADGNVVRLPLPDVYYRTDQTVRRQKIQRQQILAQMNALDGQAAQERLALPQPPFDGRLTYIGEDGVPVTLPPAPPPSEPTPTTTPTTTQPS